MNYTELPRKENRYFYFIVDPAKHIVRHDHDLFQGWYRADNLTIPTKTPPGVYSCGTQIPIWMDGMSCSGST